MEITYHALVLKLLTGQNAGNEDYFLLFSFIIIILNVKVVYILDQVRALENEMLLRIRKQGLDVTPRILIVSVFVDSFGR